MAISGDKKTRERKENKRARGLDIVHVRGGCLYTPENLEITSVSPVHVVDGNKACQWAETHLSSGYPSRYAEGYENISAEKSTI
jgi:hypothetical protein